MKILKVVKTQDHKFEINLYNEKFASIAKKNNFYETLIIIHDKVKNEVNLFKSNGDIFLE